MLELKDDPISLLRMRRVNRRFLDIVDSERCFREALFLVTEGSCSPEAAIANDMLFEHTRLPGGTWCLRFKPGVFEALRKDPCALANIMSPTRPYCKRLEIHAGSRITMVSYRAICVGDIVSTVENQLFGQDRTFCLIIKTTRDTSSDFEYSFLD